MNENRYYKLWHRSIGSVIGSLNNIGVNYQIIEEEMQFDDVDKLILPGIGSFKKCKEILDEKILLNKF